MKNQYYFQYYFDPESEVPIFLIAEKQHYDKTGYFADDIAADINDTLYPLGFCDIEETSYEYNGSIEEGREKLVALGMIEKHL